MKREMKAAQLHAMKSQRQRYEDQNKEGHSDLSVMFGTWLCVLVFVPYI